MTLMFLVRLAVVLLLGSDAWGCLRAHDLFAAYIQHRVGISVGVQHVDVTVQLTFFEQGSEHERDHADTDGDGRLSRAECDAYLRGLESMLSRAVSLRAGGRSIELSLLRAPELDLLGQDRVGPVHHRLTLFYFAATPSDWAAGTELQVEDRLWSDVRALGSLHVEGREGCRLEVIPESDPLRPPVREGESRLFKARLVTPPLREVSGAAGRSRGVDVPGDGGSRDSGSKP